MLENAKRLKASLLQERIYLGLLGFLGPVVLKGVELPHPQAYMVVTVGVTEGP